jgi:serine/threonine-protein kinase
MSAVEVALPSGFEFAGYRIVRPLGEGGFGIVYEAEKPSHTQRVALKVLRAEVADNHEVALRFLREAQAVALLKHPNIVGYVELGEHEGRPFLAMELLHGEALTELMNREGRLALGRALDIAVPIMAALRTVHAQGIVHRDLKPDNVFLSYPDGAAVVPKILDFGFAKITEPGMQITRADTAIGTPNFMSPEQLLAPREVDPRSDQWSVAVLLYYMLTGVKPFGGRTLTDTLKNVLQYEPPRLDVYFPALPAPLVDALARALSKAPAARFESVHQLAEVLLPYASDATAMLYTAEIYGDTVWDVVDTNPALAAIPLVAPARPAAPSPDAPYVLSAPPRDPEAPHSLQPVSAARESLPPGRVSGSVAIAAAVAFALSAIAAASVWAVRRAPEPPRYTAPGAPALALALADAATDAADAAAR